MGPPVGVLALQGAFACHAQILARLGAAVREVRTPDDLAGVAGLVVPGGESTTMTLGVQREGLAAPLQAFGRPVFATCAGMIMLDQKHLGLMGIVAERNAFGPQVFSFEQDLPIPELGGPPLRALFIRAPYIVHYDPGVTILAEIGGHPVAAEQGDLLATAFHPELTGDTRLHRRFLARVMANAGAG